MNFSSPESISFEWFLHQAMGQVDGQGHQGAGFLAGEAEHHALVAGAPVSTPGDVARLLVQV